MDEDGKGGGRLQEGSRSVRVNLMLSYPSMLAPPVQGKRIFPEGHQRKEWNPIPSESFKSGIRALVQWLLVVQSLGNLSYGERSTRHRDRGCLQQRLELYEALKRNQLHRASEDEESAKSVYWKKNLSIVRQAVHREAGPYRHARQNSSSFLSSEIMTFSSIFQNLKEECNQMRIG